MEESRKKKPSGEVNIVIKPENVCEIVVHLEALYRSPHLSKKKVVKADQLFRYALVSFYISICNHVGVSKEIRLKTAKLTVKFLNRISLFLDICDLASTLNVYLDSFCCNMQLIVSYIVDCYKGEGFSPKSPLLKNIYRKMLCIIKMSKTFKQDHKKTVATLKTTLGIENEINYDDHNPDDHFKCPISREIMKDPVMIEDGHTYERIHIATWFKKKRNNATSPMTGVKIKNKKMTPNHTLKSMISAWKAKVNKTEIEKKPPMGTFEEVESPCKSFKATKNCTQKNTVLELDAFFCNRHTTTVSVVKKKETKKRKH
jgi:hypothetical protein